MKKESRLYKPLVLLLILFSFLNFVPKLTAASPPEIREDGLTIILREPIEKKRTTLSFLRMIVKTGSAHEQPDKAGINKLTNEILYYIFRASSALEVNFLSLPEYTIFDFTVSPVKFLDFCRELDTVIRLDALLLHDLCNELINYHLNEPKNPGKTALIKFYEKLYGIDHPYLHHYCPNYNNLNIAEVNNWFREIFRPANLIIATSEKLPPDFLLKPAGRDLKGKPSLETKKIQKLEKKPEFNFTPVRDNLCTAVIGFSAPQIKEKTFFAGFLLTKFLEDELWQLLRQQSGLVYDVQVYYSYLTEPSAPNIKIIFQTLPETIESALEIINRILDGLKSDGIPQPRIEYLIQREKLYLENRKKTPGYEVQIAGFQVLSDHYQSEQDLLVSLREVSTEESKELANRIATSLCISLAGPSYILSN